MAKRKRKKPEQPIPALPPVPQEPIKPLLRYAGPLFEEVADGLIIKEMIPNEPFYCDYSFIEWLAIKSEDHHFYPFYLYELAKYEDESILVLQELKSK